MVKKQKEETPNVNATANRDVVQRLNFLYQANVYLQSVAQPLPAAPKEASGNVEGKEPRLSDTMDAGDHEIISKSITPSKKRRRRRVGAPKTTADLARSYVQCMRVVGQKTTVKMDPSLKRSLCSNCNTTLVPGSSASVRVKGSASHGNMMVYTCLHCKATKRISAPQNAMPVVPVSVPSSLNIPDSSKQATSSEPADKSGDSPSRKTIRPRKKRQPPHNLPLFARPDAGHVVFRGNDQLPFDSCTGFGIFCA